MRILITNDDGYHYPGIVAIAKALIGADFDVKIVAPRMEQSGISSAITFLRPLFPIRIPESDPYGLEGFTVDGTPADCVKLGVKKLFSEEPNLVISGINGGLNAGTNVIYSGTIGGAKTAASFGIPAMAISLEYAQQFNFEKAAEIALPLVKKFAQQKWSPKTVLNLNIPTVALTQDVQTLVVPVETNPLGYEFQKGTDPKGREYFWASNSPDPEPSGFPTDCSELKKGNITISAISCDPNQHAGLQEFSEILESPTVKT